MHKETVMLTPALAKKLLATNYEEQRKLNVAYAHSLARDISNGRWRDEIIVDPIIVSDTGKLMNGQHRCKAVIVADEPIRAEIIYGVPESYFTVIDCGKARLTSQFVSTQHANTVAALARMCFASELGMPIASALKGTTSNFCEGKYKGNTATTRQEQLDYISNNKEVLETCAGYAQKVYRAFHGGSKGACAFALWIIGRVHGMNKLNAFVDDFSLDTPMSKAIAQGKDKGVNAVLTAKTKHVSVSSKVWVSILLATYDAWIQDKGLKRGNLDSYIKKYDRMLAGGKNEHI